MDDRTLTALRGSIAAWEVKRDTADDLVWKLDLGCRTCPLCDEFWPVEVSSYKVRCQGCPVHDRTGMTGCKGSPYDTAFEARRAVLYETNEETCAAWRQAAQEEIDFLKSLLPPDTTN